MKQSPLHMRNLRHKSLIDIECQWWEGVLSPTRAEVGRCVWGERHFLPQFRLVISFVFCPKNVYPLGEHQL